MRSTYETISRCKKIPLVGTPLFGLMDRLLAIPPYYPIRDLSAPDFQVKLLESLVDGGLCRGMLEKIRTKPLPLITSYLAPAIAADRAGYNPVYCIICDAEVARAWVASKSILPGDCPGWTPRAASGSGTADLLAPSWE